MEEEKKLLDVNRKVEMLCLFMFYHFIMAIIYFMMAMAHIIQVNIGNI